MGAEKEKHCAHTSGCGESAHPGTGPALRCERVSKSVQGQHLEA